MAPEPGCLRKVSYALLLAQPPAVGLELLEAACLGFPMAQGVSLQHSTECSLLSSGTRVLQALEDSEGIDSPSEPQVRLLLF